MTDLLQKIQNFISRLEANPAELDVDQIKSLLSEAHTLAREGLNRSCDAEKYRPLKEQFDTLKPSLTLAEDSLAQANAKLEELKPLEDIFAKMKEKLIGKITLLQMSPDAVESLTEQIKKASPAEFEPLRTIWENQFEQHWIPAKETIISGENKKHFINPRNFKIGGS